LMTTGKPVLIISKTSRRKPAHEVLLKMDTLRNKAEIVSDREHPECDTLFPDGHGTAVTIELEGKYQKGRQSIDEYLEQTAIANPHAQITYVTPTNETIEFPRAVDELPEEPREIKPHPMGIELGTLIQMIERSTASQLGGFLQKDFCRVSSAKAKSVAQDAGLTSRTWLKNVRHVEAESLYESIQKTKFMAPPTDCLVPIGSKGLLAGLLKEVDAEFFAASTRPPSVYRGNPFQIEAAIGFGGSLAGDESARILRFANRVPLLYQQSACSSFKGVVETGWKNYGMSQPRGALPVGPLVIMIHMASVWVPFTSESKEAIADYDEIRKEMKLALQECGRKLGIYLRRRQKMKREAERRVVFERYIGEIASSCHAINGTSARDLYVALLKQAQRRTETADQKLDDEGRIMEQALEKDDSVIVVADRQVSAQDEVDEDLFGGDATPPSRRVTRKKSSRKTSTRKKTTRKTSTRKKTTRKKRGR
jgi:DNA topoisomerase-6 subunit B